jgi:hypothetical protein
MAERVLSCTIFCNLSTVRVVSLMSASGKGPGGSDGQCRNRKCFMQREMDMKKIICLVFVASLLLFVSVLPASAADPGRGGAGGHSGGWSGRAGGHSGGWSGRGGSYGGGWSHGYRGGYGGGWGHGHGGWDHDSRFYGGVWLGPGWWDPWWWGAPYYPYYPYSYYSSPPTVIQQQPPTYIQPAPQQEEQTYYWYFCRKPEGYYPYVKRCPGGWLKVVPPSGPPNEEE